MEDSAPPTAILLDRYPLWLDAVEATLAKVEVRVVARTTSPQRAVSLVEEHRPDLFITDLVFAGAEMDGVRPLLAARERVPGLKAIVLSESHDLRQIKDAFAAGALAYVTKSAHPDDLASAVRQAFSHSMYFANGFVSGPTSDMNQHEDAPLLTRREQEVLRLVADGWTNAELASMLWVTEQTVKFHLSNIYRKLGVSNRTEAGRWAQVHGLLLAA
jgi:DNA-binding NarL/FixJ family response regulator